MKAARALLLCTVLGACSSKEDPTQVMVIIDAEPQVRARVQDVEFEVRSGQGDLADWEVRLRQDITSGGDEIEWPLEVALVPRAGDAERVYLAVATARDAGGEAVAEVRAISGYQRGKTVSLLLLFEDGCLDKVGLCDEEQTCRSGGCVDAHVDGALLPKYERDPNGDPVPIPFWSIDAGADAAADAATDGGSDAGDGGPVRPDAAPPAQCTRDRECDDGDPCNGVESCSAGRCAGGAPFECPDIDDPCRVSACVNDDGEARCDEQSANEGESCAENDATSEPRSSCGRDYACEDGECEPATVQDCEAEGECEELGGCDAEEGCLIVPKASGDSCDDGDGCTVDDQCNGSDYVCAGTARDCGDDVACTDDVCVEGECQNNANDEHCSRACQVGVCDAVDDCQYTPERDFTTCDDARAATGVDFCYSGACVGNEQGAPTATCAVGSCGCSGFSTVKDLEYYSGTYLGLIDASRSAPCVASPITVVYDVTLAALTAYTTDAPNGALAQRGWDLNLGMAVADDEVGMIDTSTRSVDWINNSFSVGLNSGTPAITNLRGATRHHEGLLLGGTASAWFWGDDTVTASTARLVRCTWTPCFLTGCSDPVVTCAYEYAAAVTTFHTAVAYSNFAGNQAVYGGVMLAMQPDTAPPARRIQVDGTTRDYTPTNIERDDAEGSWNGAQMVGAGRVLFFGGGNVNLLFCDDSDFNGDPVCTAITGVPNQAQRAYYDAVLTSTNAIVLLATSCLSFCTSSTTYLVTLAAGLDPTVGSNWNEYPIASWSGITGGPLLAEVAAGGNSIMLLGTQNNAPYVMHFRP